MANMFENMDFKHKMSRADIAMNIPKEYQMMSPEWCAGYMKGYREGVNKEREGHNRPRLEEIYPEFFKDKEKTEV